MTGGYRLTGQTGHVWGYGGYAGFSGQTGRKGQQMDTTQAAAVTLETMREFCDPDFLTYLEPWTADGYTYATDGRILVRLDDALEGVNPEAIGLDLNRPALFGAVNPNPPGGWIPWADVKPAMGDMRDTCPACRGHKVEVVDCPDCDGDGNCECRCGHEHRCRTCNGDGVQPKDDGEKCIACDGQGRLQVYAVAGVLMQGYFHRKIGRLLPGVEYAGTNHAPDLSPVPATGGMVHFRFPGGDGLLMGRRK